MGTPAISVNAMNSRWCSRRLNPFFLAGLGLGAVADAGVSAV